MFREICEWLEGKGNGYDDDVAVDIRAKFGTGSGAG